MARQSTLAVAPFVPWRFFDRDGTTPLALGKLYTYAAGTLTPLAVYKDYAQTLAWPNPIILTDLTFPGGSGYVGEVATRLGGIYPPIGVRVRYVLQRPDGFQLWDVDDVPPNVGADIAANNWLPFTPTWLNGGTPNVLADGVLFGKYRLVGPTTAEFEIFLAWGALTVAGTGGWGFGGLPFPVARTSCFQVMVAQSPVGIQGPLCLAFAGASEITPLQPFIPGVHVASGFTGTVPMTWAQGCYMSIVGNYEFTP